MSSDKRREVTEIQLADMNKKAISESQLYLSRTGEWYQVAFNDEKTAQQCAKQVKQDLGEIVKAVPKIWESKKNYQFYPKGTYYFRIHNTVFETFKTFYNIQKEVQPYVEAASSSFKFGVPSGKNQEKDTPPQQAKESCVIL